MGVHDFHRFLAALYLNKLDPCTTLPLVTWQTEFLSPNFAILVCLAHMMARPLLAVNLLHCSRLLASALPLLNLLLTYNRPFLIRKATGLVKHRLFASNKNQQILLNLCITSISHSG